MGETEVGRWLPVTVQKSNPYDLWVVLAIISVMFLAVGILIVELLIVGVVLLLPTVYLAVRGRRWRRQLELRPFIRYVLTNRHAVVYQVVPNGSQSTLQACDLSTCTVDVLNRRVESFAQTTGNVYSGGRSGVGTLNATTRGESKELGDVLFMVGGIPQVRFESVRDPNGIFMTANHVIQNLKRAKA